MMKPMQGGATIHLSNHSGVVRGAVTNAADFVNVLGNSGPGKKPHAVGVKHLVVAHRFTNIGTHNNRLDHVAEGTAASDTIPPGQYTADTLRTALGVALGGTWIITLLGDGRFTFENSGETTVTLLASSSIADVIGLAQDVDCTQDLEVTMSSPVYLGGPTMLFLHSRTLAPGNMIHGDGRTYNVLETIDLSGVPYGGIAKKEVDAHDMNLVTFESPEELSAVECFFTDQRMRKLTLPSNSPVDIVLRVMHTENDN